MAKKRKLDIVLIYLKINTWLILPITLFSAFPVIFNNFSALKIYIILMLLYYLYKLPYIHIIFSAIFCFFYKLYYIKNDIGTNDMYKKAKNRF